jgi:hypothetical protein
MELQADYPESDALTDGEKPSWDRQRSTDELLGFIASREALLDPSELLEVSFG